MNRDWQDVMVARQGRSEEDGNRRKWDKNDDREGRKHEVVNRTQLEQKSME